MNERILELAEQANADIWGDKAAAGQYFDIEKFAELIVKECLALSQSYPGQNEDYAAGIDSVQDSIKQHFGIEQ